MRMSVVPDRVGVVIGEPLSDPAARRRRFGADDRRPRCCLRPAPSSAARRPRPGATPAAEVLEFCDRHDDALYRSCTEGHLTGSAIVVDPSTGRSLLIHHAKLQRWLQPGGHADGDANLAHVAWREATEETGLTGLRLVSPAIDIDVHAIPARSGEPRHLHLDLRHLVLAGERTEAEPNHEVTAARWMMPDDPEILAGGDELHRVVGRAVEAAESLAGR